MGMSVLTDFKRPQFVTIGRGVYTLAETERLTQVPRQRISRWTRGYAYKQAGKSRELPPIIGRDSGSVIVFADLIEIRFLNEFRRHGVSAKSLRIASVRAQELLGRLHPFSTHIFRTDGITILAEITKEAGDKVLLDLVKNQYAFEKVIAPYLYTELDFNALKEPERWWPLGKERAVVIDAQRAFGAPVTKSGIPTNILSRAIKADQSADEVARLFRIESREVIDAVEFETRLAA